jgi:hypothetical protein
MNTRSRRLTRIITFVGAGVVLVSFIVNDVFKEKFNGLNDSLATAQNFYLTQTYNIFIQDDLTYIKQQVDRGLATAGKPSNAASENVLTVSAQAGLDHANDVLEYVRNLATLVGALPQEQDKETQVKALLTESAQMSSRMSSFRNNLPTLFAAINQNPKDPKNLADLAAFVDQTNPIPGEGITIMNQATSLTKAVVSDLTTRKQKAAQDLQRVTALSYVLFGLGWLTSLTGNLLGIGGQSE